MTEIKDTKLIRDALGSPVPQYLKEDLENYVVKTVDGSTVTRGDIDFSKTKLLRDKLGSPIPQLWDTVNNKWVVDTGRSSEGGLVKWENIHDKPLEFVPKAHTHKISEISGLQEKLDEIWVAMGVELPEHEPEEPSVEYLYGLTNYSNISYQGAIGGLNVGSEYSTSEDILIHGVQVKFGEIGNTYIAIGDNLSNVLVTKSFTVDNVDSPVEVIFDTPVPISAHSYFIVYSDGKNGASTVGTYIVSSPLAFSRSTYVGNDSPSSVPTLQDRSTPWFFVPMFSLRKEVEPPIEGTSPPTLAGYEYPELNGKKWVHTNVGTGYIAVANDNSSEFYISNSNVVCNGDLVYYHYEPLSASLPFFSTGGANEAIGISSSIVKSNTKIYADATLAVVFREADGGGDTEVLFPELIGKDWIHSVDGSDKWYAISEKGLNKFYIGGEWIRSHDSTFSMYKDIGEANLVLYIASATGPFTHRSKFISANVDIYTDNSFTELWHP